MSRAKRCLLLGTELALWAVFGFFAWLSINCFDIVRTAPELWDYLAPDRLEERQFKWLLAGIVYAVPALGALAGAVGMAVSRRRKERRQEMNTQTLTHHDTAQAAELLRQGRLVALPTETVYGLAADATQERAVQANYDAKGRPETKPLNVLVDGMKMAETVCRDIPEDAYKLAQAFWPGPLTMILPGNGALPPIVPAGGATQGVRCPDHPATLDVIRALGRPLACPSANLSGRPSPKSAGDVLSQLAGKIDAVLDGGPCGVGVESTIVDLTVSPYRILRQGGLSREAVEAVLGNSKLENA